MLRETNPLLTRNFCHSHGMECRELHRTSAFVNCRASARQTEPQSLDQDARTPRVVPATAV